MTSVLSSRPCRWVHQIQDDSSRSRFNRVQCNGVLDANLFSTRERCQLLVTLRARSRTGSLGLSRALAGDSGPNDGEEGNQDEQPQDEPKEGGSESFRKDLERMVGADDSNFTGMDLAALIRKKYGRSYDVQLIKKEFMGRSLLAMNVMWKYREQKSFPLTEEEYILRLDDVANNLKCWGAVSHIRNSLSKLKERPRIGKAVSIFIDMDETGGRSNEWIYK